MTSNGSDLLVELVPQLLYALLATAFTAAGLAVEYASLQQLGSGDLAVAAWMAAFGAVLLYAGLYGVGYRKLLAARY